MTDAIKTSTRIYYTGDMANADDYGTITAVTPCDFYGFKYSVELDDGRTMTIQPLSFSAGPGCRFFVAADRIAARRVQYVAMLDQLNHSDEDKARGLAEFDKNHAELLAPPTNAHTDMLAALGVL